MYPFLFDCAQNYLQYLTAFDKGYEKVKIRSIKQDIFGLCVQLESKPKSLETLALRTNFEEYLLGDNKSEISISAYDERTKTLHLNVESNLRNTLFAQKDSIMLISDLRFLVQNIINFYSQEYPLSLPKNAPDFMPDIASLQDLPTPPHAEQLRALHGIFSNPFCYIWGPAGSGKTKVVLLYALAFYLKQGQKIAILAPTNNALEQCLKTLLTSLRDIGLNTDGILRLGSPTQCFMENFPQNCEQIPLEKNVSSNFYKKSLSKAQILAMTLDTFLHRVDLQTLDFKHFFIDEAAFAPLIKILPLCAFNKPITLLGDHKQLQPISALNPQDSKTPLWNLSKFWSFSALFLESFFKLGKTLNSKDPKDTPQISHIFTLSQTYRYGDNLAKLLDSYIYKNGLQGHKAHTHLYYLDITSLQKIESKIERTNPLEATLCCTLAKDFIAKDLDFAILTPFVNQRQLILKTMPHLYSKECVLTIHAAQGQEFDYVIFSPVILHYHLNNSKNQSALFALNVALSRARKEIIIVCDKSYWLKFKGQFLSDLIAIAKPYTPIT
ncbi:AAA domain-containing protein [Helicobacter turcicus]|uniref:AAA family ATPase n=1 Tax=Helicobacter turcicus TaxID=2867412 RepID=A0ABS7JKY5_9HELI|nr:DEAD/DEAH box helicase [Helicobacter turcicus]MBX7490041.1 AAA family ATPase [Helicobacter turcicus]MBX7544900.1 AAA family ATPase [Helicobacter turcicus]